ncbi:MAG: caspase family protein [Hyphomicrobiaceae bacterium]|nr:caspase family protein [Hyphomicrobiaceae bacterium]
MIHIWTTALAVCLLQTATWARAPDQQKRLALLIGNYSYSANDLKGIGVSNVVRDLNLLASSLSATGFVVETKQNLTAVALRDALSAFGRQAGNADVAIIYFTGFGVQIDQVDYLAAVDVEVSPNVKVRMEASGYVSIQKATDAVQRAKLFSMVIVEANRSDPWASRTRGFVNVESVAADSDVIVFYGSQNGTGSSDGPAGGNGPFAAALAKRILEPGIEVGLLARRVKADVIRATSGAQRPQLYGELGEREFYFLGTPATSKRASLLMPKQPRLALVIGNGDYNLNGNSNDDGNSSAVLAEGYAPDLPNASNDARDIAEGLKRLGFLVDHIENANYENMLSSLFEFEKKVFDAGEDAIVVVFYAGHALQVGGANFLVPAGAKFPAVDLDRLTGPQAELTLSQYALPLQTALLGRLKNPSRLGLNLIFLDACRENPWERRSVGRNIASRSTGGGASRSRGLGEVRIDLRRTALAFATKPGDVADDGDNRNSPYTTALKAHLEEPGLSVLQLLDKVHQKVENDTSGRQVPWTNAPSLGQTCLAACQVAQ